MICQIKRIQLEGTKVLVDIGIILDIEETVKWGIIPIKKEKEKEKKGNYNIEDTESGRTSY